MMGDWEGLAFELGSWKNTGTFILKGVLGTRTSLHRHLGTGWVVCPCVLPLGGKRTCSDVCGAFVIVGKLSAG